MAQHKTVKFQHFDKSEFISLKKCMYKYVAFLIEAALNMTKYNIMMGFTFLSGYPV